MVIRYAFGALGTATLSYGAWLAFAPAGFIVLGLLLLVAQWEVNR